MNNGRVSDRAGADADAATLPIKVHRIQHGPAKIVRFQQMTEVQDGRLVPRRCAALAAGCTVVIRPSAYTPLAAMELVNLLIEAGIPDGVVNLINGDPAGMGQEMLDNPLCAKIHFTGSQRVGRLLMDGASKTITRLSLELGGNAPVLIFPDVDLDQVAAGAVTAKFRNAGQVCVSPQRFFVHRSIAAGFAERVVALAANLRLGNGLDDSTTIGPLINARQRDHIKPKLARAGLAWANFQAMRRTHSTLMGDLGIDGKLVAGQCGHTLDVSQNVYRQSPVASRLPAVNELEKKLLICDRSTDRARI